MQISRAVPFVFASQKLSDIAPSTWFFECFSSILVPRTAKARSVYKYTCTSHGKSSLCIQVYLYFSRQKLALYTSILVPLTAKARSVYKYTCTSVTFFRRLCGYTCVFPRQIVYTYTCIQFRTPQMARFIVMSLASPRRYGFGCAKCLECTACKSYDMIAFLTTTRRRRS